MFKKFCGIDPYILENIQDFENLVIKCRNNDYLCLISTKSKSLIFLVEEKLGYGPNRIIVNSVPQISEPLQYANWRISNGFLFLPTNVKVDLTALPKTPTMALAPINFYPGHARQIIHRRTKYISQELDRRIHDFVSSLKNTYITNYNDLGLSSLIGYGPGLFPIGDRILCGIILTARAINFGNIPLHWNLRLIMEVKRFLHKTTEFAASFLNFAIEGRITQPQTIFFQSLSKDNDINIENACEEIINEEFSGIYFLLGVRIVLDILRANLII